MGSKLWSTEVVDRGRDSERERLESLPHTCTAITSKYCTKNTVKAVGHRKKILLKKKEKKKGIQHFSSRIIKSILTPNRSLQISSQPQALKVKKLNKIKV